MTRWLKAKLLIWGTGISSADFCLLQMASLSMAPSSGLKNTNKPSMGVVYSGCWGGTISVQVNASELASRSGTREKECDLQVLSELGSHSPTPFYVSSSYGKWEVGLRIAVDRLPDEMNDMKIRDDKEVGATVIDGNGTETGHIIVTTIGGRNGQPKQTVSYMAERVVGHGSFGIVFQAKCLEPGET